MEITRRGWFGTVLGAVLSRFVKPAPPSSTGVSQDGISIQETLRYGINQGWDGTVKTNLDDLNRVTMAYITPGMTDIIFARSPLFTSILEAEDIRDRGGVIVGPYAKEDGKCRRWLGKKLSGPVGTLPA